MPHPIHHATTKTTATRKAKTKTTTAHGNSFDIFKMSFSKFTVVSDPSHNPHKQYCQIKMGNVKCRTLYLILITAAVCFMKLTRFVNAQSLHLIEETCLLHGDGQRLRVQNVGAIMNNYKYCVKCCICDIVSPEMYNI